MFPSDVMYAKTYSIVLSSINYSLAPVQMVRRILKYFSGLIFQPSLFKFSGFNFLSFLELFSSTKAKWHYPYMNIQQIVDFLSVNSVL